jgi:hypothetical protein
MNAAERAGNPASAPDRVASVTSDERAPWGCVILSAAKDLLPGARAFPAQILTLRSYGSARPFIVASGPQAHDQLRMTMRYCSPGAGIRRRPD